MTAICMYIKLTIVWLSTTTIMITRSDDNIIVFFNYLLQCILFTVYILLLYSMYDYVVGTIFIETSSLNSA